jgi:hypothetical protein
MDKKRQTDNVDQPQGDLALPSSADIGRRKTVTFLVAGVSLAAAGLLTPRRARAYYGKCYKCSCCQFEGTDNQCRNCGHAYNEHSGQTC